MPRFDGNPHREARDGIENLYSRLRAGRRLQIRQNRNSPCFSLLTGERGPRGAWIGGMKVMNISRLR